MQVKLVKEGKPYVMFGDGTLASCKPISEANLAAFMADCVAEPDKANRVLPIGGAPVAYIGHGFGCAAVSVADRAAEPSGAGPVAWCISAERCLAWL